MYSRVFRVFPYIPVFPCITVYSRIFPYSRVFPYVPVYSQYGAPREASLSPEARSGAVAGTGYGGTGDAGVVGWGVYPPGHAPWGMPRGVHHPTTPLPAAPVPPYTVTAPRRNGPLGSMGLAGCTQEHGPEAMRPLGSRIFGRSGPVSRCAPGASGATVG